MSLHCTTCGAHEYRKALRQLGGEAGGGLANALAELSPSELAKEPGWQDALLIAIRDLPFSLQLEGVLEAWLPKIREDILFSDFVLFKIVKYVPVESDIRKQWISECILLAQESRRFSLIESLLLVFGKDGLHHTELIDIAKEYARSSKQMRRVLRNACGIES